MKQKLTSEDIACLVPSLNNILDGAYLVQIYDGSEDNTKTIILKLRNKLNGENKMYYLLIESGIRMHTIESFKSIRQIPSGCVGKIRKEIGDKRLYPIKQLGTDRSIDFLFSNEKHLIIELYDRGNIILTDNDYKIIFIARPYKMDAYNVDVNEKYPIDIISTSGPELKRDIKDAKGYMVKKSNFSGFPIDSKNVEEFEDINQAIKAYFNTTFEKKGKKKSKKSKKNNRQFNIQGQIDKLDKNEDKALNNAINLEENVEIIQEIINIINDQINNKIAFNNIKEYLKQTFTMFKDIKVDHLKLILDGNELDYKISAYNNVSKLFSEKKKFKQKKNRAIEVAENMKITEEKIEAKKEKLIVNRKVMKFENYWWFIYNGFTVLCGKSADDNETLLNNMEPSDILIHGHFDKSPWGIIKNPNKLEVSFKVINYAGQFIVQRSWNWTENYANDSYYTYPDKVSKSAPSGEYMGKGSRMVHEKNFLSNANLEMGVGVIFKCGNEYVGNPLKDSKIDFAMVMCAPYMTMSDFDFKIKVRPSGKKSDKGRKKLLQSAISKILKMKTRSVISRDYIRAIPYEEWDKTCIRTFTL